MERHRLGALPATLAERLLADAMAKCVTINIFVKICVFEKIFTYL